VNSIDGVKDVALIVNPFSTRVTESRLRRVEEELKRFARVETLPTGGRWHAIELAQAASHDAVLVFSGDGVFNEVLNGIEREVPLGFIPGGRTNVLPRALGLPREPVAAARQIGLALESGRMRTISLGRVNGRRFSFGAGIGLDAELIRRIDERGRTRDGGLPGDLTVGWLLARELSVHRGRYRPALEIEGLGRAAFALVANADPYTYVGSFGLRFVPEARFELGLDLVAPVSVKARTFGSIAAKAFRGRMHTDFLYGHDLDRIDIVCDEPMPLHADGEDLGDVTEAHFECEREAVNVLV
jgi:diacylglycerol kinase family enzyme